MAQQQPLRERSPLPVRLLSNEDSQNSVLGSRFASCQGTMGVESEDGQLKGVQRPMEERERVISALDPKLKTSLEGSLESMQNPLMGRLVAGGGESSDVKKPTTGFVSDIA